MITNKTFLCQLTQTQQNKILKKLKDNLINEGFNETEIQKMLDNAKDGRLIDLEENMDVKCFINEFNEKRKKKNNISSAIILYRNKLGMSQESLADKIGVTDRAMRYYETGDRTPSEEKIIALAEVLGSEFKNIVFKLLGYPIKEGRAKISTNTKGELSIKEVTSINITADTDISKLDEDIKYKVLSALEHYLIDTGYDGDEKLAILEAVENGCLNNVANCVSLDIVIPIINEEINFEASVDYKQKYEELLAIVQNMRTKVTIKDERGTVCGFELDINEYGNIAITKGTEITCYESDMDEWHDEKGDYQILEVKCDYK